MLWPGYKKKRLVIRRIALESRLPPHNGGAARRVSENIESRFHGHREFLSVDLLACPSRVTGRASAGYERRLFSFAGQFRTTDMGTLSACFTCELIKNRCPSRTHVAEQVTRRNPHLRRPSHSKTSS